ncbi:MAG: adenylate kinase [Candidatus Micrarchaeota archaeon]
MIIVFGTPGAGKTTILSKATEAFDCKEINYGDFMFEIAQKKGFVSNRDDMRKMPIPRQKEIQADVAKNLSELEGKLILNTHALISTPVGYIPGLSRSILSGINIEQLILVVSPPADIVKRRQEDTSRTRDPETEEQISEVLEINKSYLFAYSVLSGAPAAIVVNANGKLEEAVESTRKILEERWHD